ncbi:MAG: FHA domain-containing protein [Phycisphaerae bacterium]|jgi:hypothetical protein|nr:FHA domain-containing protein [Phycisphaerae bacterium]
MAAGQAELVYVKGPQAGQRASLMLPVVTVGRGQQADVQLTEEHVSRKHFQLTLTQDGWVFENHSPLKSRVNGKKYKTGKKIILDTGDVIAVGSETELLFVATGDDPEAALIAYRQGGAKKGKSRSAPTTEQAAAPVATPQVESSADQQDVALEQIENAQTPEPPEEEEEVELSEDEEAALAQKAKVKKYATIFGAYLGVLAALVVIFASMVGPRTFGGGEKRPAPLDRNEIEDLISAKLSRDKNAVEARIALDNAFLALDRTNKIDHLYKGIYWFKLARAYGKVLNTEEERVFVDAMRRLTIQVQDKYRNAYAYERDHKYKTADGIFRELLAMLPSMGRRNDKSELVENIKAHVAYIKRQTVKNKKM